MTHNPACYSHASTFRGVRCSASDLQDVINVNSYLWNTSQSVLHQILKTPGAKDTPNCSLVYWKSSLLCIDGKKVRQPPQLSSIVCHALSHLPSTAVKLDPLDYYSCLQTVVLLHYHKHLSVHIVTWLFRGNPSYLYAGALIK